VEKKIEVKPVKIGRLKLQHGLIQGPLAGISCAPFRALFSLFKPPAYCVTEMISAKDLISRKNIDGRYVYRNSTETKLCYQLSGNSPNELATACDIVENLGADLIDLNCGCPKSKIRRKGCGSNHLENADRLGEIVAKMRATTSLPLTVKIRTAGSYDDDHYLAAVKAIEQAGADALIVHGRHWQEDYEIATNYQQIAELKKLLSIPVIANGDVCCKKSLRNCLQQTGADGVMIARGGIGRPWIYQALLEGVGEPGYPEDIQVFMTHIRQLSALEKNEFTALLQARRLIKFYFKGFLSTKTQKKLFGASSINELETMLVSYSNKAFKSLETTQTSR
jgi:tRNA-dihydrouridine synthase B